MIAAVREERLVEGDLGEVVLPWGAVGPSASHVRIHGECGAQLWERVVDAVVDASRNVDEGCKSHCGRGVTRRGVEGGGDGEEEE